MPRPRSPNRDKAFDIWLESLGTKPLKDIATELGATDPQIRKWKNQDKWNNRMNSNVTKRTGAPKENQNAAGNQSDTPIGNTNAEDDMKQEDLPLVLNIKDLMEIMRISRDKAYEFTRRKDFPVIRQGSRIIIPRDAFFKWLNEDALKRD